MKSHQQFEIKKRLWTDTAQQRSTMLDNSKSHAKRKKTSVFQNQSLGIVVFLIILLCLGMVIKYSYSWNQSSAQETDLNIKEYEALLARAKELTSKYKDLSARIVPAASGDTQSGQVATSNLRTISPNKGQKGDLVLGMAQDTDPKNLAVFCKSLRSVSQADVIIFANEPVPPRHKEIAKQSGVTLIGFDLGTIQPAYMQKYHPSTLRWPLFFNHFNDHPELVQRYDRVWMIDVRDSFFQSDPFSFVAAEGAVGLHVFNGVESFPIQSCGWNSGWIKDCFGDGVLNVVGSKGIICSGVTAGKMAAGMEYIRTMNGIITGQDQRRGGKFPQCERNGVDQGVHNVLVHTGALSHLQLQQWSQSDGPVANMQAKLSKIDCSPGQDGAQNCVVRNQAGAAVNVVHQYDRYPDLQQYLFHKYVDWVKTGDLEAEWADEPACRAYGYKPDSDMFKAVCDLKMKGGVTAAAACCAACDQARDQGCQAFTFYNGACFLKNCGAGGGSGRSGAAKSLQGAVSGYLK